jgi:hypothetical protein
LKFRVSGTNVHGFLIIVVRSSASQKNYAPQNGKNQAKGKSGPINFLDIIYSELQKWNILCAIVLRMHEIIVNPWPHQSVE